MLRTAGMLFSFEFYCIRLSHEEVMGLHRVLLSALSHTGWGRLPWRSVFPGVCVWQREAVWVGGESNHKHIDPNNTDNLVNTAEAIVTSHYQPPLLSPDKQISPHNPKFLCRNSFMKLLDVCWFPLMSSCTEWWNWYEEEKPSRKASITADTKNHILSRWSKACLTLLRPVIWHQKLQLSLRGREDASQRPRTGRDRKVDNTRQPTSEQKQHGSERGNCTKQLQSASKAHPRQKKTPQTNPALSSVLSCQSDSCLCGSTSERGGKRCESMTGREDGWEEEEVQKESPD